MTNLADQKCYCDTGLLYEECCGIYHNNFNAPSALVLMRSRYSAYVLQLADYLIQTTHSSERHLYSKAAILEWAKTSKWEGLEIIGFTENTVEFKAFYKDFNNQLHIHHEFSNFEKVDKKWFYVDGIFK